MWPAFLSQVSKDLPPTVPFNSSCDSKIFLFYLPYWLRRKRKIHHGNSTVKDSQLKAKTLDFWPGKLEFNIQTPQRHQASF